MIEQRHGAPLATLFEVYGQGTFRRFERDCLTEALTKYENVVIATAGGVVADEETFAQLLEKAHVIWLQASPAEHMRRVMEQGDFRPMEHNRDAMKDLVAILDARAPLYGRAHATVDTSGKTLEACVAELVRVASLAACVEELVNVMERLFRSVRPLTLTLSSRRPMRDELSFRACRFLNCAPAAQLLNPAPSVGITLMIDAALGLVSNGQRLKSARAPLDAAVRGLSAGQVFRMREFRPGLAEAPSAPTGDAQAR